MCLLLIVLPLLAVIISSGTADSVEQQHASTAAAEPSAKEDSFGQDTITQHSREASGQATYQSIAH